MWPRNVVEDNILKSLHYDKAEKNKFGVLSEIVPIG